MMKVKKNRLSGMEYDEVSHVDVGANQHAKVAIFKRDTRTSSTNRKAHTLDSGEVSTNRKESRHMATEVVEKRKGRRECAECGSEVPSGDSMCPECDSTDIKKSIIIVRKEVSDDISEEEHDDALEALDDEDEDDDDIEDDEEDDDEEEEDDEEPVVEKSFTDAESASVAIDALSIATEFATKIAKAFKGGVTKDTPVQYESLMTELNDVMDGASQGWLAKSFETGEISKKAGVVRQQITDIIKNATEGGVMPQHTRPAALDTLALPAEVTEYIAGLEEGSGIEKNDIFKGLSPEVVEIVKKAQETNEAAEVAKWEGIAKKFDAVPGDKAELAKSLRALHATDETAYDALVKSLEGANEAAKRGDITKSWGAAGGGEPTDVISKRKQSAQKLVETGQFPTVEQAEIHLLSQNPSEYGQN